VPDSPTSVAENQAQRSSSTIGLTWSDGASNGGLAVIDYRINQRVQGGSYSVIATGISTQSYTATGLTLGTTYEFTVEARNTNGHSSPSTDFTILHAVAPDTISTPTTTNSGTSVIIDWTAPSDNGSTITYYTITIRQSDGTTYTEDSVNCDGSDNTIKSNT
jgi:hypothetical protein